MTLRHKNIWKTIGLGVLAFIVALIINDIFNMIFDLGRMPETRFVSLVILLGLTALFVRWWVFKKKQNRKVVIDID